MSKLVDLLHSGLVNKLFISSYLLLVILLMTYESINRWDESQLSKLFMVATLLYELSWWHQIILSSTLYGYVISK